MAYFSNSSEGAALDAQCARCRYGNKPCPIAAVQLTYNYDACNNPTARAILDSLIAQDGSCAMFKTSPRSFRLPHDGQTHHADCHEHHPACARTRVSAFRDALRAIVAHERAMLKRSGCANLSLSLAINALMKHGQKVES